MEQLTIETDARKFEELEKMENINELLERCKENLNVFDAIAKAHDVINSPKYKNIMCSISGGSDSDIMLDLLYRIDYQKKITYVWFDTGLEYKATKEHLKYLEDKYKIIIHRERAVQPIPTTCRTIGQPFISKQVSEMIERLQEHGFKFEDKPYDELVKEYEGCSVAIKWWCNEWGNIQGKKSRFDISRNKYLKEFMVKNPPTFKIANKCCKFAKKDVAKKYIKDNKIDLNITGVRRSEGGEDRQLTKRVFQLEKALITLGRCFGSEIPIRNITSRCSMSFIVSATQSMDLQELAVQGAHSTGNLKKNCQSYMTMSLIYMWE